ncbi:hypothetical protein LINPERPRIM_LOCUS22210, partial [Linum perenne]
WKQRSTVIGESQQYTIRYGLLQQYAFKICHYGASTTNFDDAHSIMKALSDDMEMRKNDNVTKKGTDVDPEFEGMKNPLKAKAKGSGKRRPSGQQRRCAYCLEKGHNTTTCEWKKKASQRKPLVRPMTAIVMRIISITTMSMMKAMTPSMRITTTPMMRMITTQVLTTMFRIRVWTRITSIHEEVRVLTRKQRHNERPQILY